MSETVMLLIAVYFAPTLLAIWLRRANIGEVFLANLALGFCLWLPLLLGTLSSVDTE